MTSKHNSSNFHLMTDKELRDQMAVLTDRIDTLRKQGAPAVQEELDFCYVSRELEERATRRKYDRFKY